MQVGKPWESRKWRVRWRGDTFLLFKKDVARQDGTTGPAGGVVGPGVCSTPHSRRCCETEASRRLRASGEPLPAGRGPRPAAGGRQVAAGGGARVNCEDSHMRSILPLFLFFCVKRRRRMGCALLFPK